MTAGKAKPQHDKMWRLVLDGEIEVLDGTKIEVKAVTVGDADKRAMDDYARAAARATYEAALDVDSELYNARTIIVYEMDRDALLASVKESERFRLERKVVSEIYPAEIKRDIETIGDSIELDQEVERTQEETDKVRAEWVKDQLDTVETEYADISDDTIREKVKRIIANNLATVAFSYAYQDYAMYCGIRMRDGTRFFAEVPKNTPESIKAQALALYSEVDPYLFPRT
ncbi:MAG: hypothetical protein WBC34_05405 [Thiofilum sp.]